MPELQLPNVRYQTSFLAALKEYHAEHLLTYENLGDDWMAKYFEGYIAQLAREAKGQNLPPGFVQHTVFWLVEGEEYLGRLDIRHELNEFLSTIGGHIGYDIRPSARGKGYGRLILQLGLEKAKALGLKEVLITCDVTNAPSNHVIRANGGVLQDTYQVDDAVPAKNRYLIRN